MKRIALLVACAAVLSASTGCCCMSPCGGGYGGACGYQQQAAPCGPCGAGYQPYGAAMGPGAGFTAGLSIGPTYAAAPYPVVATAPMNYLPTY